MVRGLLIAVGERVLSGFVLLNSSDALSLFIISNKVCNRLVVIKAIRLEVTGHAYMPHG